MNIIHGILLPKLNIKVNNLFAFTKHNFTFSDFGKTKARVKQFKI